VLRGEKGKGKPYGIIAKNSHGVTNEGEGNFIRVGVGGDL